MLVLAARKLHSDSDTRAHTFVFTSLNYIGEKGFLKRMKALVGAN